ncbi:hypothetical protein SPRG_12870 [Saprolegnia parasitica CBS 223.65]|uniref:BTB domain-containing protein n=1 Tax=Saprolegnia parasitica (strain CBS 223.65) TaxID=695850 RepID=A0A067BXR2_SAPPC|nr:hypothetical protein SPRG_12870 [Saprolegnia parasitica CBS 223.65]KDO21630.1 hypothetical protein SPRG_12870 [Saprolegnia parasitica CBS 223.65]|eukprot:XP_012207642.1 hypothetical protein SPRG_12870 [Saprolegnia parasitica CBS 223.65]
MLELKTMDLDERWATLKAALPPERHGAFDTLIADLESEMREVQVQAEALRATEARMARQAVAGADVVSLNIGGTKFATSRANLARLEGSFFHAMLASKVWQPNADGEYFIDVDPKHFGRLMRYIRTGDCSLTGLDAIGKREFRWLLHYFSLDEPSASAWDPQRMSKHLDLTKDATLVTKRVLRAGDSYVMAATTATRFVVKVSPLHPVDIGFSTSAMMTTTDVRAGYFFRCPSGLLHSFDPTRRVSTKKSTSPAAILEGDLVVTAIWDVFGHHVRFEVNGKAIAHVLGQIPDTYELIPTVWLSEQAMQVELVP